MKSRFNSWRRNKAQASNKSAKHNAGRKLTCEVLEDRRVLTTWVPAGPSPIINGQVEKIDPNQEVIGAIQSVVAHPTNPDIAYVGAVNGGVWRTDNATEAQPDWTPLTDHLTSLSIGDLEMDSTDPNTLLAGIGRASSFGQAGGDLSGLALTHDGGENWTEIQDPLLVDKVFSGVFVRGDLMMAVSNGGFKNFIDFDAVFGQRNGGLFRSTDGGATWTSIDILEPDPETLERTDYNAYDLVSDPTDPNRFYMSVQDIGIFMSEDAGETWTNISQSDGVLDLAITTLAGGIEFPGANTNTEMSVNSEGRVYVGVIEQGQVEYLGHFQPDTGWVEMDLPFTIEVGGNVGLQPRQKAGAQGSIHFSILADPDNPEIVYVGGDRQAGDISRPDGNSIGATDFSGRLFRGYADRERLQDAIIDDPFVFVSPQWEHLTHSDGTILVPDGGTANGSAPHADSRGMTFDANGDILQVDDGGVYRRTSPKDNTGDWFSMNGDLQVTEIHDIAYDSFSDVLFAGTQDVGTVMQLRAGNDTWEHIDFIVNDDVTDPVRLNADGGDVAVDDSGEDGVSYRFTSSQNLGFFRRLTFDENNVLVDQFDFFPINAAIGPRFVTPLEINSEDSARLILVADAGIFESMDRGNDGFPFVASSFQDFNPEQNAFDYGGRLFGESAPAVLYAAIGADVQVRAIDGEPFQLTRQQFPGGFISDLAMDENDWRKLYVTDRDEVFMTPDGGRTWVDITGDLNRFDAGEIRRVDIIPGYLDDTIVIGTNRGVYYTSSQAHGNWQRLGTDPLPNAPVYDMEYDPQDDVLAVGLLGRGAWVMHDVSRAVNDQALAELAPSNTVSGRVFADANENQIADAGERGISGVTVYIDVNENEILDDNEAFTTTLSDGTYNMSLAAPGGGTERILRIVPPAGTTQTTQFFTQEEVVSAESAAPIFGVNFGLSGITGTGGGGFTGGTGDGSGNGGGGAGGGTGTASGMVFADTNGDGTMNDGELPIDGAVVYIDVNDNCIIGLGEPGAVTNSDGEFRFDGLTTGIHNIRMSPVPGYEHEPCAVSEITVDANGIASASPVVGLVPIQFDSGETGDGVMHRIVDGFHLGATVLADPEPAGAEDDNDGVIFATGIQQGELETVLIEATQLSVSTGFLQGWIDYNGDGKFKEGERIFTNQRLEPGINELTFRVPARIADIDDVTARFRYGFERGINATAESMGGEVEDYTISIPGIGNAGLQAENDTATLPSDSDTFTVDVLANDRLGFRGGAFDIVSVSSPTSAGGSVEIATSVVDGVVTKEVVYTAPDNFLGPDTFTYTISNGLGDTSTATVTVNASFPIANDDAFNTSVNESNVVFEVLVNDFSSPTGNTGLTIVDVASPTTNGGSAVISGNNILYTPAPSFIGSDSFSYTISDGTNTDTATVTIDVDPLEPIVRVRLDVTDSSGTPIDEVNSGQTFQLRGFTEDLRDNPQGVFSAYVDVLVNNFPLIEFGSISYGPDYPNAQDGTISDGLIDEIGATDGVETSPLGGGEFLLFTVDVTALSAGDVEFIADFADILPFHETSLFGRETAVPNALIDLVDTQITIVTVGAIDDVFGVDEDTSNNLLDVIANDVPPEGAAPMTLISVSDPANGTATVDGGQVSYTPDPDFFGLDTFQYVARDSNGTEFTGNVSVNVSNINDEPQAFSDTFEIIQNTSNNQLDVLANDSSAPDPTETLLITAVGVGNNGGTIQISGDQTRLIYTPAVGFLGEEMFTYTIDDGNGATSQTTVVVNVVETPTAKRAAYIFNVTDLNGNPLGLVEVGQQFQVQVLVQDLTQAELGVFSAYLDVLYDQTLVSIQGEIDFNDSVYPSAQKGDTSVPGIVDELGAVDGISFLNTGDPVLLATLSFLADAEGTAVFDGDPADIVPPNETILFGTSDIVQPDEMEFITDEIVIGDGDGGGGTGAASPFTNTDNPVDVNEDTNVSPLDALIIINDLNTIGARELIVARPASSSGSGDDDGDTTDPTAGYKIDVNGDNWVSPIDALLVINALEELASQSTIVVGSGSGSGATDSTSDSSAGVFFDVDAAFASEDDEETSGESTLDALAAAHLG